MTGNTIFALKEQKNVFFEHFLMDWRKLFQKNIFHCTIFYIFRPQKWHCDEPICNFTRILVVVGVIKTLKSNIFYGKLVYYTSVLEPSFLPIYTYFYIYPKLQQKWKMRMALFSKNLLHENYFILHFSLFLLDIDMQLLFYTFSKNYNSYIWFTLTGSIRSKQFWGKYWFFNFSAMQ